MLQLTSKTVSVRLLTAADGQCLFSGHHVVHKQCDIYNL